MKRMFCCALLILSFTFQLTPAQAPLTPADLRVNQDPAELRQMLSAYLNQLVQDATAKRLARFHQVQSEADFRLWQESNRQAFLALIGGLPEALHALRLIFWQSDAV